MHRLRSLVLGSALVLAACHPSSDAPPTTPPASSASSADLDARRRALAALIADQWEYTMRTTPEWASILGDKRYNDRWSDLSDKAQREDIATDKEYVAKLRAIDPAGFPEQEALNRALLLRKLELEIETEPLEPWLMPVAQNFGPHIDVPQLVAILPFDTVKDYDDYVARLRTLPNVLEQTTANMRAGLAKGLMPPRFLLAEVAKQSDTLATAAPEASPFAAPLQKFPAAVGESDRARIRAGVIAAIRDQVEPAYVRFAAYVRSDYEPHGRVEPGVWSLPLGAQRYQHDVAYYTTTRMTADEIHELGLREVARIEGEMNGVAKKLGFADVKALAAALDKDPARHFHSRQEIVDAYRRDIDQMYAKLPSMFGRLPKAKVEVMPVEEFREKGASGAQYVPGTPDGSRPGHVMVNTGEFEKRETVNVETTAYHEGVPGHHLQMTIAQEITGLPPFRQQYYVGSFIEGWALYSERLGEEVGFYQDPYSYYGHLQDEMLRAIRLVVDTGIHAKRWSRQQVVDFFHAHTTADEVEVQSETDRYIADPGQALSYKIGQLRILALRERAKQALGDRFDLRAFHDVVLGAGAVPMDVLEERVDAWIARAKAG